MTKFIGKGLEWAALPGGISSVSHGGRSFEPAEDFGANFRAIEVWPNESAVEDHTDHKPEKDSLFEWDYPAA
jgi:hypothetical protein